MVLPAERLSSQFTLCGDLVLAVPHETREPALQVVLHYSAIKTGIAYVALTMSITAHGESFR